MSRVTYLANAPATLPAHSPWQWNVKAQREIFPLFSHRFSNAVGSIWFSHSLKPRSVFLVSSPAQVSLSPIKVVRNPDGSLQQAALAQSALAKERREIRDQAQKQMMDSVPLDLSRYASHSGVPCLLGVCTRSGRAPMPNAKWWISHARNSVSEVCCQ